MSGLVAVTGVTGFIGGAILSALSADGWRVRVLVRRNIEIPGIESIHGHLLDQSALTALLQDVDAVIHCAGRVRGARQQDFHVANVEGTARLAHAAAAQPHPPRFLLISSLAAREPGLSWYAASKHEAELVLDEQAGQLAWTIFRPTAVYGPGDRELKPLFTAMRYGILPVPGRTDARLTLLHVDDLVAAVRKWLTSPATHKGPYELDDGTSDGYSWSDIRTLGETALNRRITMLRIPGGLLTATARVNLWLGRIIGYAPMLTPGKICELRHPDWRCNSSTAIQDLGWEPRIRLMDSLRKQSMSLAA
jgi:nucleoside-diphosphate-sugar epimerase